MGLDIYSYEILGEISQNENKAYICSDLFPEQADGLISGHYNTSGKSFSFRAGSYSSYNWWRDQLCNFANKINAKELWASKDSSLDFYYLIYFSDCEGTIGPKTSAKLYNEFVFHKDNIFSKLDKETRNDKYFIDVYNDFTEAFRLAKDTGVVCFH